MSPTSSSASVTLSIAMRQSAGAVHRVAGVDGEVEDRIFELVAGRPRRPGVGVERVRTVIRSPIARSTSSSMSSTSSARRPARAAAARRGRRRAGGGSARRRGSRPPSHCRGGSSTSRRGPWSLRRARSRPPTTTASMLLKSCAMPPVSWPTASIFWTWRSCASAAARSAASAFSALLASLQLAGAVGDRLLELLRALGLALGLAPRATFVEPHRLDREQRRGRAPPQPTRTPSQPRQSVSRSARRRRSWLSAMRCVRDCALGVGDLLAACGAARARCGSSGARHR